MLPIQTPEPPVTWSATNKCSLDLTNTVVRKCAFLFDKSILFYLENGLYCLLSTMFVSLLRVLSDMHSLHLWSEYKILGRALYDVSGELSV